ncbi:MAG TPA: histidine kinase [Solirubrobacteraceae bacterium]|jgi:signal transduction histidine kinase
MNSLRTRIAGIDHARLDALLAIAIIVQLELEIWLVRGIPDSHRPLTAAAAVLVVAPLAVRRRWPAGALVCCSVLATIQAPLGGRISATSGLGLILVLVLLAYSTGAWLDLRRGALAVILAAAAFSGFVFRASGSPGNATDLFFVSLLFAAPWFAGRLTRERTRRAAAFRELAAQAATEREERERAAIAEERVRIGRELQDIIAHNVNAMVIQAGGARQLLRTDPERARATILNVEQVGREALGDLRRVLGMLRKDEDPHALAPQPGLDQLAALLDSMSEAGLECNLHLQGEPVDLTPGVDLVGYRVIEAALRTAAASGCGRVVVTVCYRLGDLELQVQGGDSIPDLEQALRGISDRVALYGGSLRATPANGFAVHAHLPLTAAVTA